MALYIDSASLEDIKTVARTVPLSGVTTNPTILLNAYQQGQKLHAQEVLGQLLATIDGKVFMQPSVIEEESSYQETLTYIQVDPDRVIPKIPMTEAGMRVARRLCKQEYHVAFTAVTTISQAYTAAMVGADFVILYYNRLRRCGADPFERVSKIASLFHSQQLPTRIMAASIKSSIEASEALTSGAHDLTVPPQVLLDMVRDPETEKAVQQFEQNYSKLKNL